MCAVVRPRSPYCSANGGSYLRRNSPRKMVTGTRMARSPCGRSTATRQGQGGEMRRPCRSRVQCSPEHVHSHFPEADMATVYLIFALLLATIAVIFAVQNTLTVSIAFMAWKFT